MNVLETFSINHRELGLDARPQHVRQRNDTSLRDTSVNDGPADITS